ncbi:MAG: clpC [Candidatus Parcubacteria bacterium]|nr:clpC [Candidatus Parcubacteria bacterium]
MIRVNYTPRLHQVLALARKAALRKDSNVEPYHLLLAIVRLGQGVAWSVLEKHYQINNAPIVNEARELFAIANKNSIAEIGFSQDAVDVMVVAAQERETVIKENVYIGTEHVLLALVKNPAAFAGEVFVDLHLQYGDELTGFIRKELEV